MNIKVCTNISSEYKDIEVCINAPDKNDIVMQLEQELLQKANQSVQTIIGIKNNDIFIINIMDIIEFFTEDRAIFCRTKDGNFCIKEKLYYLEEILPQRDFVRISNSVIININQVRCFNTSIIGKIVIKFKDGTEANVAKRKVSNIMKILKERRG